jgi:hypothetical protein
MDLSLISCDPAFQQTTSSTDERAIDLQRSRWLFWVATPVCLACLFVPFVLPWKEWGIAKTLGVAVCTTIPCVFAPLALFDSRRFWWATRSLTAIIFLGFTANFINRWFFSQNESRLVGSGARPPAETAVFGLLIFALPALWYTLFGRLTLRKTKQGQGGD